MTNLVKKLISNGLHISVTNFEMKLISKSLLHFYVRNLLTKLILCGFSSGFCGQYCKQIDIEWSAYTCKVYVSKLLTKLILNVFHISVSRFLIKFILNGPL